MSAYRQQQEEEEAPYNQAWPHQVENAVNNNSAEIEGLMRVVNNIANSEEVKQGLNNLNTLNNLMNGNFGDNNNNNNNEYKDNDNDNKERPGDKRPGHKRQFTDIVSEALQRPDVKGWLSPYLSIFTLGGGIGFVAGMSTKKMGKVVLKTTIGSILIIQVLNYKGYIQINYQNIKNDINSYIETKENENYMQYLLKNVGPVLAGFGLGFHLG